MYTTVPRTPVTVVVPVWNAWDFTRRCLDSLRPTLGARDQVVVVDNGSEDATPGGLRRYPWIEVVSNETNLGFARACNQGAAAARHPIVVFLNNDTVVPGRWLDTLVEPLAEEGVVAAGPRSNFVSGPQMVPEARYPEGSVAEMRRFARDWMQSHRGLTTEVERLVGFCLAVRTDAFRSVGGFDEEYEVGGYEDDDLCLKLARAGGRLVIAHGSFVHHQGHVTFDANGVSWAEQELANRRRFLAKHGVTSGPGWPPASGPLVSACLITKDEEENLPLCLASLAGFADEVVVYDTGSSDRTVEVARAAGARVVEGRWTEDFSEARNAALAHCGGRWILWIDADETLLGDLPAVRVRLAEGDPRVEGLQVLIENLLGNGLGARSVHPACRLFRRDVGRWAGRFHEQVVGPEDRALQIAHLPEIRLLHRGYTDAAIAARGKVERNLRLARAEVERVADRPDQEDPGMAWANLGRTLYIAGRYEESLAECARALEHATRPLTSRLALRMMVESHLAQGHFEDALATVAELRSLCRARVLPDFMEARAQLLLGRPEAALPLLEGMAERELDDDNFEYAAEVLSPLRAQALAELHRPGEAADVLLAALSAGSCDVHVGTILELLLAAGRDPGDLGRAVPDHFYRPVLAQVLQLAPEVADMALEGWWQAGPAEPVAVLAAAANLAVRLSLVRALEWSARLRGRGLVQACPLLRIAADPVRPPAERVRAAAVAFGTFGGGEEEAALRAALACVPEDERDAAGAEVALLCPRFGAAGDPAGATAH